MVSQNSAGLLCDGYAVSTFAQFSRSSIDVAITTFAAI